MVNAGTFPASLYVELNKHCPSGLGLLDYLHFGLLPSHHDLLNSVESNSPFWWLGVESFPQIPILVSCPSTTQHHFFPLMFKSSIAFISLLKNLGTSLPVRFGPSASPTLAFLKMPHLLIWLCYSFFFVALMPDTPFQRPPPDHLKAFYFAKKTLMQPLSPDPPFETKDFLFFKMQFY